jgi:hypothetical protein
VSEADATPAGGKDISFTNGFLSCVFTPKGLDLRAGGSTRSVVPPVAGHPNCL